MTERDGKLTVVEVLEQARALIADQTHWCQNALAVDAEGCETDPSADDAMAWCALGAIYRASDSGILSPAFDEADAALWRAIPTIRPGWTLDATVADVNDGLDHAAVLALYDCAIAEARRQELVPA